MHVLQGNPAGARQEYECLLSAWKATEDTMTIFPTLLDGTLFYAEIGDLLNSRRWLAELEDVMQVTDNPVGLAALQEGHGVIRAAQGDLEGAISALRLAVEAWKRLQLRLQWARTSQRLARLLLEWARRPSVTRLQTQAAREEAAQLLAQAESVYRDLDISPGVEAVRALRCGKRLEAQEKRRQTMLARSDTSGLTRREMEVLSQLGLGKANKEIAAILHISIGTVEQHISHIFDHLGCDTRAQAIIIAMERGLLKEKVSLNGN